MDKDNNHNMEMTRGNEYTLEEIAKILGITRERVRQIEQQALRKLKAPNNGRKLKQYLFGD